MTRPVDVPELKLFASGDRRSQYVRVRLRIDGVDTIVCMSPIEAVMASLQLYRAMQAALTEWKPDFGGGDDASSSKVRRGAP